MSTRKMNQQQIAAIQRYPYWARKLIYFFNRFPLQLWLVFLGNFIISVASSMSWPFLNIYLRQRLGLPLHLSTLLASTRAVTGIAASLIRNLQANLVGLVYFMVFLKEEIKKN